MPSLSRRGFLVLGGTGAAGVALSACGSQADPRAEGDDPNLLATAIEAETAYGEAATGSADQQGVSAEIAKASRARLDELRSLTEGSGAAAAASSQGSNVSDQAMAAIAAYRAGARLLSTTDLRATAAQLLAQVAAELAALRELDGESPAVPYAFVTGLPEPPLATTDNAPSGTTTTSTTQSSSTSTTSSTGGG